MKIAVLGFGTVGSGVCEVLTTNAESIEKKAGEKIEVSHILDIRDFSGTPYDGLFTKDFDDILNDDEVSVVVEVMGGLEPAYTFTKNALLKGKHVVTSNKELVATHGDILLQIAKEKNVNYLFEASVGGGIPIIQPLNNCLTANEITEIAGILNGTTNYILSQMIHEGQSFKDALSDAQEKGYAERNPDADVKGYDACRKIAILSSLVFGKQVDYSEIYTEGIENISLTDVEYIGKAGCVVKLLGVSKKENGKIYARVSPAIVEKGHPLSGIEDVFNGILVKGNAIGDVMFYGRGAGKLPTASAVVADVIDCARSISEHGRYFWEKSEGPSLADYKEMQVSYYARILSDNKEELKNKVLGIINGASFIDSKEGELVFITPKMQEKELICCFDNIKKADSAANVAAIIRKID